MFMALFGLRKSKTEKVMQGLWVKTLAWIIKGKHCLSLHKTVAAEMYVKHLSKEYKLLFLKEEEFTYHLADLLVCLQPIENASTNATTSTCH